MMERLRHELFLLHNKVCVLYLFQCFFFNSQNARLYYTVLYCITSLFVCVVLLAGSVTRGADWCAESAVAGGSSGEGLTTARVQPVQETQPGASD